MARVPSVPTQGVTASPRPLNPAAPAPDFSGLRNLERGLGDASDALFKHAEAMQAIENKAAVDDATINLAQRMGQFEEEFKANNRGIAASQNLGVAYKDIEGMRADVAGTLRTPAAQQMFQSQSRMTALMATQRLGSFATTERKNYVVDKSKGAISLITQNATADNFDESMMRVADEIGFLALPQVAGMSEEEAGAMVAEVRSKTAYNIVDGLAQDDPMAAEAFMRQHDDDFNPQQRAQLKRTIKSVQQPRLIATVVDDLIASTAMQAATGVGDNVSAREAIAGIESGGNYGIRSRVATRGDYAYGKYQIMGKNVKAWTKEILGKEMSPADFLKNPAAQDKVFDAKFGEYVQKYGSPEEAASVWFTGRPISAASAAAKDAFGTTGAEYVRRFREGYGAQGREALVTYAGTGGSQIDLIEARLPDMLDKLRANPVFEGQPELLDRAEQRLLAQVGRLRTVNNIANGEAVDRLQTAIAEGNLLTEDQVIAAYPGATKDWNQIPQSARNAMLRGMYTDANRLTPERQALEAQLMGESYEHPEAFLKRDLSSLDLAPAQQKKLFVLQKKMAAKQERREQTQTGLAKALSKPFVKEAIKAAGLETGTPEYSQFIGGFAEDMAQWYAANPGKQPNDQDFGRMAADLLAQRKVPGYLLQLGPLKIGPKMVDAGAMAEVPADEEERIRAQIEPKIGREMEPWEVGQIWQRRLNSGR